MVAPFRYDRTFPFAVGRDALWEALNETDRYAQWWPWLRAFDAPRLGPGAIAHCKVRAPLPYTLAFSVHIEQVDPGRSIAARVSGDLEGPARLEVAGDDAASSARLVWTVALNLPLLSAAALVARPVLVWAHDRVVSNGVSQFRARGLSQPS